MGRRLKELGYPLGHAQARDDGPVRFVGAKLAWLVASLASLGGALGSMVESDTSVREAAYRSRADERTEALDDD